MSTNPRDTDLTPFTELMGPEGLLTAEDDMAACLSDWRKKLHGKACAVARPKTVQEVAGLVRLCAERGIAMVPQGGNTGLCGGATPDESGHQIVVSTSRLTKVRQVDPLNNTMTVEAGCVLANVQEAAASVQRLFPLSLAAEGSSQIGGLVSTNAGGTAVLRYGNMRDLVLGLEVVLPSGEVFSDLAGLRKDNTGYDVGQLFIGAEGTLGIVTAATLKLFSQPRHVATAFAALPGLDQAVALLRALEADWGEAVTTYEVASQQALSLVHKHFPDLRMPVQADAPFYCLFEIAPGGRSAQAINEALEKTLADAFEADLVLDATIAQNVAQGRELWRLREEITESEKREGPSVKHDVSVAVSQVPSFVEACTAAVTDKLPGARVVVFGHLGDGSLHVNVLLPANPGASAGDGSGRTGASRADQKLYEIVHGMAAEYGGSFSAEHGVGKLKRDELLRFKDPVALSLMRQIKQALDPAGLMNPGKVL